MNKCHYYYYYYHFLSPSPSFAFISKHPLLYFLLSSSGSGEVAEDLPHFHQADGAGLQVQRAEAARDLRYHRGCGCSCIFCFEAWILEKICLGGLVDLLFYLFVDTHCTHTIKQQIPENSFLLVCTPRPILNVRDTFSGIYSNIPHIFLSKTASVKGKGILHICLNHSMQGTSKYFFPFSSMSFCSTSCSTPLVTVHSAVHSKSDALCCTLNCQNKEKAVEKVLKTKKKI